MFTRVYLEMKTKEAGLERMCFCVNKASAYIICYTYLKYSFLQMAGADVEIQVQYAALQQNY